MNIGFIGGTGNLGYGLAVRCANAGYAVTIGSRSYEKAIESAGKIREALPLASAVAATNEDAAKQCDLLFLSLPFEGHEGILPLLAPYVTGKTVVDTTVPMVFGRPPKYQAPPAGSAAENVKRLLPDAIVLSGFHTVSAASLADLQHELTCDALLCGEDDAALETVMGICSFLPHIYKAGPLSNAQSIERLTPLVITLNQIYKKRHIGIKLTGIE